MGLPLFTSPGFSGGSTRCVWGRGRDRRAAVHHGRENLCLCFEKGYG